MKHNGNMYFQARKRASTWNDRLSSREKAAELLGVHESSLADYELDNVKVVPVDRVNAMADLYRCPELKTKYCKYVCPLGEDLPIATDVSNLEAIVLRIVKEFDNDHVREVIRDLIAIGCDGKITDDETELFGSIITILNKMMVSVSELKMYGDRLKGGTGDEEVY